MVAASREFVCIRPQTYESVEEAEILSWVFSDRQGNLHNTSFGILSSDGKRKLSKTGRSPGMVYGDAETFEQALRTIAEEQGSARKKRIEALPVLPDLRIALDVAAADLRPLVVVYSPEEESLERLLAILGGPAWSEELIGRLRYVVLDDERDLAGFEDMGLEAGITIVQAEPYGRGGEVLVHAGAESNASRIGKLLAKGLARFDARAKNVRDHLRKGAREGIEWESAIPVSDPRGKR